MVGRNTDDIYTSDIAFGKRIDGNLILYLCPFGHSNFSFVHVIIRDKNIFPVPDPYFIDGQKNKGPGKKTKGAVFVQWGWQKKNCPNGPIGVCTAMPRDKN